MKYSVRMVNENRLGRACSSMASSTTKIRPKGIDTSRKRPTFSKAGSKTGSLSAVTIFFKPAWKNCGRPALKLANIRMKAYTAGPNANMTIATRYGSRKIYAVLMRKRRAGRAGALTITWG